MALATCADVPALDEDGLPLLLALDALGIDGAPAVWDAPAVAWDAFDLVVLRSTWDYAERHEWFLAWVGSLPAVLNPAPTVRWNIDKERYLADLAGAGVPSIPTDFLRPGEPLTKQAAPFVIKPTVSAGGRSSGRFEPAELAAARALVAAIHAEGRTAMVQPLLEDDRGETSLVYLGGVYSHALHRSVPLPGPDAGGSLYLEETLAPREPTAAERRVAEAALAETPGAPLLYARVDLLHGSRGAPLVLEVEVTEPSLYLGFAPGSVARFADAIAAATSQRRRISAENGPTTSQ